MNPNRRAIIANFMAEIDECLMIKFYVLLLIFLTTSVMAQKTDSLPANRLSEVVISRYHINDSLMNAPASVGILSEADLQRSNNVDIAPALNLVAGVLMQSGNYNTNRISIRGIGARTPYGTNKIRAFFGPIPLTSGDSETTIEDLDIENIEQVEIIKGPLSSVYGAGLGGAILLTPKLNGELGNNASVSTTHGSFGMFKSAARFSINRESGSLIVNYHKIKSDGWRENSAYDREGVTLSGELLRRPKSKLTYIGNYTYMKSFIPSSIDRETFDTDPRTAAFTWKQAQGFEQYDSYMGGLSYEFSLSNAIINTTSVFVNHKISNEPRPFDILRQNTTAYGARTQFAGKFSTALPVSYLFGVEYFRDRYAGQTYQNLYQDNNDMGSISGDQLSDSQQHRTFYNAFAQARIEFSKRWELQTGINVNQTWFTLDTKFPVNSARSENYKYDRIWTPQISVLYKPDRNATIYFSASRGFSLPAIEETLTPDGGINPNIKPETGYNFEIGGKFTFFQNKLFVETSLYRMLITDLLVAQRIGDDQYVGVNAGETLHQGIELSAKYRYRSGEFSIEPFVAASLGQYEFEEFTNNDINYSGKKLPGVPAETLSAGINLSLNRWYLLGTYRFVGELPLQDSNMQFAEKYSITDLKAGYQFEIISGVLINISGGVNNIGNQKYASMVLPNATGFGAAQPRFFYPGLPLNYFANFAVSYRF